MSDFVKNLPGVVANSISQQTIGTVVSPVGQEGSSPAGIIGTAGQGPAFVPLDIGSNSDFETVFGEVRVSAEDNHFGALGANSFFAGGGSSVVYCRTLGAGDCKPRVEGDNAGRVNNAGFVVGSEIVNTGTNLIGPNTYAGSQNATANFLQNATATWVFTDKTNETTTITLTDAEGTSVVFEVDNDGDGAAGTNTAMDPPANSAAGMASILISSVNASALKITATSGDGATGEVLLTQDIDGNAGNTAITLSNYSNWNANTTATFPTQFTGGLAAPSGPLGRAYFLTAFMSQSDDSTIFSDSGLQTLGESKAAHIIRGMLFAPSGVVLSLSSNLEPNNTPVSDVVAYSSFGNSLNAGCNIGTLNTTHGGQTFVLFMNGHKSTTDHPNAITASLNPQATFQDVKESLLGDEDNLPVNVSSNDSLYFANVFNTDPTKIQEAGHYLYTHYDIFPLEARPDGSGIILSDYGVHEPLVMLLTSSVNRNTGSTTSVPEDRVGVPNFENFEDRYTNAFSPYIVSQKIGPKRINLFRFYSFSDGNLGSSNFRVVISNIQPGENSRGYTKFNVELFEINALESDAPLIVFEDCDLDPSSDRFISKVVGDTHTFYDFDQVDASQKIVVDGTEPITNQFIRVKVSREVSDGTIPKNVIPVGFRGIYHLVTSGSSAQSYTPASSTFNGLAALASDDGTELILRNTDGSAVTFTTDSDHTKNLASATTIGTLGISSNADATEALYNAFSAAVAVGTLKMALTPAAYGGETEITLTQLAGGTAGNKPITIPANITANGTTGADTGAFTSGNTFGEGPILTGSVSPNAQRGHSDGLPSIGTIDIKSVVQPPMPMRERISLGVPGEEVLQIVPEITWGAQYSRKDTSKNPNAKKDQLASVVKNLTKLMPSFHTTLQSPWVGDNQGVPNVGGCILDADRFNRNLFTLENVIVITGSTDGIDGADLPPHPAEWPASIYSRTGKIPPTLFRTVYPNKSDKLRFVDPERDLKNSTSRSFLKFTVPMHGSFDGLNIFDEEAVRMSDVRVYRERLDSKLAGKSDSTTAAYIKGLEILSEKSNTDVHLLATPGIKHRAVTDKAVTLAEEKFNVLYVSDVEPYDVSGSYVTSSLQPPDVKQLSDKFSQRALGSSFAAFYYPDLIIDYGVAVLPEEPAIPPVHVPATVGMLSAFANNDSNFGVGSSPMGPKRGAVSNALSVTQGFTDKEKQRMLDNSINVFVDEVNLEGVLFVNSQKTSLDSDSSFTRINVRRLIIDIRRQSRDIARQFLMQPNTRRTRDNIKKALKSMLAGFVTSGEITEFRVAIFDPNQVADPVSTVNALNEIKLNLDKFKPFGNLLSRQGISPQELSTVRGTVFIKPTQSDEVVQLDIDETTEE